MTDRTVDFKPGDIVVLLSAIQPFMGTIIRPGTIGEIYEKLPDGYMVSFELEGVNGDGPYRYRSRHGVRPDQIELQEKGG